jgi:hypothetical protein
MLVRMILACSAILSLALPATAQDCLKFEFAGREALVRKAPTCDKAMEQLPNCAAGGTGDVILAQIVVEKCERTFLKKLSAGQRRSYDGKIESCNAEHKNDEGTLSRAMAATCRADLAQSYAHKYGKP